MTWLCADFERWLDDGLPEGSKADASSHVAECERCAAALAAAHSVEETLALSAAVAAPAGFTNAVMRRIDAAENSASSYWKRLVADPVVISLGTLAVLLAWNSSLLVALVTNISSWLVGWTELLSDSGRLETIQLPAFLHALAEPTVLLGIGLVAVPAMLWMSWRMALWLEQEISRPYYIRPSHVMRTFTTAGR